MSGSDIETTTEFRPNWRKLKEVAGIEEDVLPLAVQDARTLEVLIIAFVSLEALKKTLSTRVATFWSTSRNVLWIKGATSGDILEVEKLVTNCEQNSFVLFVNPQGQNKGACHVKGLNGRSRTSCYYREVVLDVDGFNLKFLQT